MSERVIPYEKPRPARWWFLAAVVLAVLAFWVLPSPWAGVAALLTVGAFITAGSRVIRNGDPETGRAATRAGFPGDGGGFGGGF